MLAARAERDHRGLKRYDNDPAFRQAVEAKDILGTLLGGSPEPTTQRGTIRVVNGVAEHLGPPLTYIAAEGEIQAIGETARIESELRNLQVLVAEEQAAAATSLRIRDRIDPTQPVKRFASPDDMVEAMRTPEYKTNPTVRAHIEARIKAGGFSE